MINGEKLISIKSRVNFDNLKSVYFLIKIFEHLKKWKYLELMKYNKNLQTRLNLSINDYKDYSQLYSPIEIELKFVNNEHHNSQIINIYDNMNYYHIFFDNSTEETKETKLNINDNAKVKVARIIIDYQVKSFKALFSYCNCIRAINFKKFFRTNITNMSGMFSYCYSLREINLSNFNTNNVTNMSYMFNGCSLLRELNLSKFNTNIVTNVS